MRDVHLPEINILVVDDRREDLLVVRSILDDPRYNLVTASSGKDALRRVLERDYAVMLLDVYLPDMDGFEVASIIRQRERSRYTPIIFLTAAGADVGTLYRGYSVGAVDYLVKPIDQDVLRAKVGIFVDLFAKDLRIKQQAEALIEADRRAREREVAELKQASEKRYRDLAEAIPPIVWTAGPDGTVSYFNHRWYERTGQTPDQAEGWGWMAAMHPEDSVAREEPWRQALATGGIYEAECRIRGRDGSYRWHLCRAVPEKHADGRIVGWLGTYTDCDDLKRALAAAEATRGRLEALAEASAHLAGSLGQLEGLTHVAELVVPRLADWCVIELWNAEGQAERVITVHAEPVGRALLERLTALHPAHRRDGGWLSSAPRRGQPELVRNLTEDARRALAHDGEHERLLAELAPSSFMAVPLRAGEHVLGALTIGTSASARRYEEADLSTVLDLAHRAAMAVDNSRLYREAQQAIALRDEFLSIASHELRTPLTALQLQLQTLMRMVDGGEPKLRDKTEKSIKQTRRLEKLVENLLDVTRIIGGRLTLEPEEVDLAETVRDVAERFTDEAARAGCPIRVAADAAPVGHWDRLRLEQVATNLISNAVKYAAGAPIDVRVEQGDAQARLIVTDHGQGIPPESLGRIFGRFERATDRPHYGGLGLGLYIVRHIVEAHGGSIRAASEPGRGATFTVELPLAAAPAP